MSSRNMKKISKDLTQELGDASLLDRKTHTGTLSHTDWPPKSSEFKIIEAVWNDLDRAEQQAANIQRRAQGAWITIPEGYLKM